MSFSVTVIYDLVIRGIASLVHPVIKREGHRGRAIDPASGSMKADHTRSGIMDWWQHLSRLGDGWARAPRKGVPSCDMPRGGARSLRSGDPRMGLPVRLGGRSVRSGNPGN